MPKGIKDLTVTIFCHTCNKKLFVRPGESHSRKFCSRKCANDRNPTFKICPQCQKEFRDPSDIFCSRKCYNLFRRPPEQTCPQCNKTFVPKHRTEKECCSVKCQRLALRKRVTKICLNCKKEFWVWQSKKNRAKYCSKSCRAKQQFSSQEENEVVTIIAGILKEIPERAKTFTWLKSSNDRNMYLDAYFPNHNIAIEYDGKQHRQFIPHYHKSIKQFEQSQERDTQKEKLCKKNGIILIRITDEEKRTKEHLKRKIYGFI